MKRNKIIAVDEAVRVILNNDTVAISGFGGTGVPEELAMAIETRFLTTGGPRDLTLIYAACISDARTTWLKHFDPDNGGEGNESHSFAARHCNHKEQDQGVVHHPRDET